MKNNSTIHKEKTTFQSESTIIKKGRNDNARHLSTRLPYPLHHTESLDSVLYSKVMTRGPGEVIGVIERKEMLTSCLSLPRHSGAFFLSLFFCHFVQKKTKRFTVPCRRRSWTRCGPRRGFPRRGAASRSCTERRAGQSVERIG